MKTVVLSGCLLLFTALAFSQRTDASRDARVGGTREGAVQRAEASQDTTPKSELKELGKHTKTGTLQLKKEFHSAQQNIPNLTFDRFKEIKLAAFNEQTNVKNVINEMTISGETNAAQAAKRAKAKAQDKQK